MHFLSSTSSDMDSTNYHLLYTLGIRPTCSRASTVTPVTVLISVVLVPMNRVVRSMIALTTCRSQYPVMCVFALAPISIDT